MSAKVHPFLTLDKLVQLQFIKELRGSFSGCFAVAYPMAIKFMDGRVAEIDSETQALVDAMTAKANEILGPDDFEKNYLPWKGQVIVLTGVFPIAKSAAQGLSYAALAMGGLTLWSFRSSKLLAAANGCACLALVLLGNSIIKYVEGLNEHSKMIEALNVQNRGEFSSKIDQNYVKMERSIPILQTYFTARKRRLGSAEHQGLQLLRQDVSAIQAMMHYFSDNSSYQMTHIPIAVESEKLVNLSEIKAFFERFEMILRKGKGLAFGGTLMGMAYLYCAYVNRAYVMIIAGLTFTLMNSLLFSVARSYEIGAATMLSAEDHTLIDIFNQNVAGRLIPQAENEISLQQAIVIRLDRILRLIPI